MRKTKFIILVLVISMASIITVANMPIDRYTGIVVYLAVCILSMLFVNGYLVRKGMANWLIFLSMLLSAILLPLSCFYWHDDTPSLSYVLPLYVLFNFFMSKNVLSLLMMNMNAIVVICAVSKISVVYTYLNHTKDCESIGLGHLMMMVAILYVFVCASLSIILKKDKKNKEVDKEEGLPYCIGE